ncbi:MAG: helix-turn-helix transcriptional regulator [Pseudolabrys sp.]|nr:helix-turn-helix transcriptional regulator [Pseudolabrys sp.]
MELGVSQSALGDALGVTFQQIQKYEKGTNRISASRLQRIADELKVPVAFFFGAAKQSEATDEPILEFLKTTSALHLVQAFTRIGDAKVQSALVRLIDALAKSDR